MAVEIHFGNDFIAVWVAKRTQVGSTIVPKIDLGGSLGGPGGSWGALNVDGSWDRFSEGF